MLFLLLLGRGERNPNTTTSECRRRIKGYEQLQLSSTNRALKCGGMMRSAILFVMLFVSTAVDAFSQVQVYGFVGGGGITPGNVYTYWSGPPQTAGIGLGYIGLHGIGLL